MGKKLRDEDLRLNIIINGDPARKKIGELNRQMVDLQNSTDRLRAEQKKLREEGLQNTERYQILKKQVQANVGTIKQYKAQISGLRGEMKLEAMTLTELSHRHAELRAIQRNTIPGTETWKQTNKEIKAINTRMAQLRNESKATNGVVCNMAERMNHYIGLITAGFAGLSIVRSGINRARGAFNEYDEALNNMRKTTGLTADEAEKLSRRLANIDTRTPQNELMGMARVAGKLGIAKDDLYGFVKAADVLKISLGKDLGDDVEATLGQIGKLVTVFHITDEFGIEQAMMKAGAAINELGKSSTANEANIVNFTKRVAGVAASSKISMADVTGLGAAVDACGIQIETAGTAISNVITGMFKRTRQFAAVAKMPFEEFADLLNKDVNEALNRVLAGMANVGGMENVVAALDSLKIQGSRSVTVLSTLANNTDILRAQQQIANQAFKEGTSCLGEFGIMNESATAKMEKAKKAVTDQAVALGRQLTPAINVSLSASTWSLKIIGQLVSLGLKYKAVIIGLAVVYASYTAAKKLSVAWDKATVLWQQAKLLLSGKLRIALAREAIEIYATRNAANAATKATMLWCAAKNLLTGNIRAAALAMKSFFMSIGPVGWATLAISGLVAVGGHLVSRYKDAHAAQRLLNDSLKNAATEAAKERAELDRLKGKLAGCKDGTKEYSDTKAEIIKKFGKYDSTLKDETLTVDTLASKYDDLTAAIYRSYNARQYEKYASEQSGRLDRTMTENLDKIYSRLIKNLGDEKGTEVYTKILNSILGGEELEQHVVDIIDDIQAKGTIAADSRIDSWIRNIREAQNETKKLDDLARARFGIKPDAAPAPSGTQSGELKSNGVNPSGSGSGDGDKWSLDKDALYQQKRHALKKQYLAGEITTEKEYNSRLLALDIATLQRRLALNVDDAEQRAEIQNTLDDKLLQQRDQNNKWTLDTDETYLAAQLDLKNKYLNKEIASEAEYDDLASQLEITALQNRLDKNIEQGEERTKLEQQLADKLLAQQRRNAQRQAEADEILADAEADKIAQENRRYQLERQKFAGQSDILAALQKRHERRIAKIQLDAANDRLSQETRQYQLARKTMQNQHRRDLSLFSGNARQRKALRKRQYEELAALDAEQLTAMVGKLQSLIDTGEIDDIKLDVSLLSDEEVLDLRSQLQDLVAQLQGIKGTGGNSESPDGKKLEDGYVDNGASFLGLSSSQWKDMFDGNLENWKDWADSIADIVTGVGDATMQLWGAIDKRQTAIENKQLKKFEKDNDKKKKALEKRLNAGLITEAQYNAQIEAMDAEYDAYQEELALKQAKRQRAMDITQAIINTAVGVTKSLTGMPWPINLIAAAATGAMGAAQVALIASTPISAGAEEGGFQDVTRQQDGRRFKARLNPDKRGFIDNPTLLVAENGTEYVIPNDGLQNPTLLPLINTMETARRNGTLRSLNFESGYPTSVSPGLAAGGVTSTADVGSGAPADFPEYGTADPALYRMLYEAIVKLSAKLDDPLYAYVTLMGKNGLIEQMNKYNRNKNLGKLG